MEGLRIEEHADKYTHDCSGGTKRKLSYGMAMLGTNNRVAIILFLITPILFILSKSESLPKQYYFHF